MKMLPIPDDKAAWHALRGRHVGASEVAALFHAQPAYAPGLRALWEVKAGRVARQDISHERAAWGLRLEEAIAAAAEMETGWKVLPGQYASREGLGATLDRIIPAPAQDDMDAGFAGPGVLELKNVDWLVARRGWGGEPPLHILLQLQAQLAATGYAWGAVAALVGGNELRLWRYSARPKLVEEILRRVSAFWESVADGNPPPPDGSDATFRALIELSGEVEDMQADLSADNEAPELAARYRAIEATLKPLEAEKAEIRNRLFEKLGAAKYGFAGSFRIAQAVTAPKPDREAKPGEIIRGRAESRRLIITESEAA